MLRALLISALLLSSIACQRERADPTARANTPAGNEGGNTPQQVPVLPNALISTSPGACAQVAKLGAWGSGFEHVTSFLKVVNFNGSKPEGGIDISESPFVQLYFGEKFVFSTPEEFLAMVEVEYAKGNISWLEYTTIQAAKISPSLLKSLQVKATNDKLADNFQGVFGDQGSLEKSLHMLLVGKTIPMASYNPTIHNSILTTKLPLYSIHWEHLPDDARGSLIGAISSLGTIGAKLNADEKLCGLVLWQRAFAQLLAFKGYLQPELTKSTSGNPITHKVTKLTTDQTFFKKVERTGALFDPRQQKSVVASASDLSSYDPNLRTLQVTKHLPWIGQTQETAGSFTDMLYFMESLVYMYAASSPSAPWFKNSDYIFVTDINDGTNKGVVPSDGHNLSLGLLKMNLKNLSKYHIVQVDKNGKETQNPTEALGFVPVDSHDSGVSLKNVVQLTRIAVYLDQALGHFKEGTPAQWALMNPLYDRKTLAQLVGDDLFTSAEIETLLTAQERSEILKNTLARLRLPLASLITQMALGAECSSHWSWNLKTGERHSTAPCSAELKKEAQIALRTLAMHIGSPVLYKQANQ